MNERINPPSCNAAVLPPAHRTSLTVPAGFSGMQGLTYRYRGWFMRNEDLLTGWAPGDVDGTGMSLRV